MQENDFAIGSIIGACLGDAIGSVLEFGWPFSKEAVDKALTLPGGGKLRMGAGQFTDDSEMAMCQINALKNRKPTNGIPADELLSWYRRWASDGPFDIGITTTMALVTKTKLSFQEHIERVKKINDHSKSNGSMMRMTPLCVWSRNLSIQNQVDNFRLDSQLTHPNLSVLDACSAYGLAISSLIKNSGDVSQSLSIVEEWITHYANDEIKLWFKDSTIENLDSFKVFPNASFVRWAFTLAFYFLRNKIDYLTAIKQTITLGGDTDTNAAIVGGIVGARIGIKGLPSILVEKMLNYEFKKSNSYGHIRPDYLLPKNLVSWITELIQISSK